MRNRILIAAAVLAAVAGGALFGGALRSTSSASSASLAGAQAAEDFKSGFALNATTASLVADFQSRLRANPKDEHSYGLLGLAYEQRARETGDPSWYPKAEGVLRRARALALDPKDSLAMGGLGSLALSRHRFRDALALGEGARTLNPYSAQPWGVIGDAQVELGRYREAFASFDRMNKLRPGLSSYARVSYGRELIGHTSGAIRAMKLPSTPPRAALSRPPGRMSSSASSTSTTAVTRRPNASTGWPSRPSRDTPTRSTRSPRCSARRAATGRRSRPSGRRWTRSRCPSTWRRSATSTGSPADPARPCASTTLIGAIERLLNANGVKTDLEIALFQVDHGIALRHALARARIAHAERPSIDGADLLAWALARNGRCAEALPLLAGGTPPGDTGRSEVLPPRDDRALSRPCAAPHAPGSRGR